MSNGLVVPDTNVLLDLYRYQPQTRKDLLDALTRLSTVWIPHQVKNEFWGGRLTTIRDSRRAARRTAENLRTKSEPLISEINEWANIRGADPEIKQELTSIIKSAIGAISDRLDQISEQEATEIPEETFKDPVLRILEPWLDGRVGDSFDEKRYEEELAEAEKRKENRIPPGFGDKQKDQNSHGDYFVWAQILDEAEKRGGNVLFLTRDKKPDWWRMSGKEILGPRGELVRELMGRTNGKSRLFFLTPEGFLRWTEQLLGVRVSAGTIVDIERVENQQSGRSAPSWSQEELGILNSLLDQSDGRVAIEQLPEGEAAESYFDVIVRMCILVNENEKDFEDFVDDFQINFPNISLRSEAKRRASCLFKLGLVERTDKFLALTEYGKSLIAAPELKVVQSLFLERIKGGRELQAICLDSDEIGAIRAKLKSESPPGITQNQATLILRWLEQLQLI